MASETIELPLNKLRLDDDSPGEIKYSELSERINNGDRKALEQHKKQLDEWLASLPKSAFRYEPDVIERTTEFRMNLLRDLGYEEPYDELGYWINHCELRRGEGVYYVWLTDKTCDDSHCKGLMKEIGCSESGFLECSSKPGAFLAKLDENDAVKLRGVKGVDRVVCPGPLACVE